MDEKPGTARMATFSDVRAEDLASFSILCGPTKSFSKGEFLRHQGDREPHLYLLKSGWLYCSIDLPDGFRQITKIHLPGDLVGMPSMACDLAADTIQAATDAVVEVLPLSVFAKVFHEHPRLAAMLFMWAQEERVHLMRRLSLVGKMKGPQRIAALLLDLYERVLIGGTETGRSFNMPLTQPELADATGMTTVHANRSLKDLRDSGILTVRGGQVTIQDLDKLRAIANAAAKTRRHTNWL
jgi:CRP/FNR family transcriptional regulator